VLRAPVRPLALLLAVAVASGCTTAGGGGAAPDPTQPVAAARADLPVRGGSLRFASSGVISLDPALADATGSSASLVADALYDGLTRYDAPSASAMGALATSWSTSADGRSWTFTLSESAAFSDGRAVTAADVKRSIERVAARGESSLVAPLLSVIDGYAAVANGSSSVLRGVVARDATRLDITLATAYSALPELLAAPAFGVVPRETPAAAASVVPTATTGPFTVGERDDRTLQLVRSPGSTAMLDEIRISLQPDADAAFRAFADGGVDVVRVPAGKVGAVATSGGSVVQAPGGVTVFYGFNLAAPAVSSLAMRQAINKAIDRDAIRSAFFADEADVMTGLIAPGLAGARDNACGSACLPDVAAAKALVAKAFPDGKVPIVTVNHFTDPAGREAAMAKAVVDSLAAAGIPAVVDARPAAEYQQALAVGGLTMFRFGRVEAYPSADTLGSLFGSKAIDNVFSFADAELDAAVRDARASNDAATRSSKLMTAEDRVLANAVVVPIVRFRTSFAVSSTVKDLRVGPLGSVALQDVWLAR
jgi:oligopeptide transport system substrate-binding protein